MAVVEARSYSRISGATSIEADSVRLGKALGDEVDRSALVARVGVGVQEDDGQAT
jgi:hypothetical protein